MRKQKQKISYREYVYFVETLEGQQYLEQEFLSYPNFTHSQY